MADKTKIEWTRSADGTPGATWNPLRGCTRVSAGCMNCYAEAMAARFCGPGQPYEGTINPETKRWNGKIKLVPEKLEEPLHWTRPRRIFVNSMSDLFHPEVPFEFIADVFAVMWCTTRHTYQILTKRPARMLEFFKWLNEETDGFGHPNRVQPTKVWPQWTPASDSHGGYDNCGPLWPPENVWLGVSIEDQATADERIPLLLQTPAAVRWVSAEPLLGPVHLGEYLSRTNMPGLRMMPGFRDPLPGINWVVAGGESGPNARPMHPDWVRSLRDQCAAAGVPFLFKQWGEWVPRSACYHTFENEMSCADLDPGAEKWPSVRLTHAGHDGRRLENCDGGDDAYMQRIGKKTAGRLLDGVLHDEYPEVRP